MIGECENQTGSSVCKSAAGCYLVAGRGCDMREEVIPPREFFDSVVLRRHFLSYLVWLSADGKQSPASIPIGTKVGR
jgi:hypothetical protein